MLKLTVDVCPVHVQSCGHDVRVEIVVAVMVAAEYSVP